MKHWSRLHRIVLYCIILLLLYHFRIALIIKAQRTSLKSCLSHVKLRCQLEVPGADGQVETLNWEVPDWWDDVQCDVMCNVREVSNLDKNDLEMFKSTFQIVEHGRSVTTVTFSLSFLSFPHCGWNVRQSEPSRGTAKVASLAHGIARSDEVLHGGLPTETSTEYKLNRNGKRSGSLETPYLPSYETCDWDVVLFKSMSLFWVRRSSMLESSVKLHLQGDCQMAPCKGCTTAPAQACCLVICQAYGSTRNYSHLAQCGICKNFIYLDLFVSVCFWNTAISWICPRPDSRHGWQHWRQP